MGRMSAATVAHEFRNPAAIVQANACWSPGGGSGQNGWHKWCSNCRPPGPASPSEVLDIARYSTRSAAGRCHLALDASVAQVWAAGTARPGAAARAGRLETPRWCRWVRPRAPAPVLVNLLDNALRYMGPGEEDSLVVQTRTSPLADHTAGVERRHFMDKSVERQICLSPAYFSSEPLRRLGLYICSRELCQGMAHPSATSAPHATPRVESQWQRIHCRVFAAPRPWNLPRFSTRS